MGPQTSAVTGASTSKTSADTMKTTEAIETKEIRTGSSSDQLDQETSPPLQASSAPAQPIISFWRRKQERARFDELATQPSVFDDPTNASFYTPPASYENAHRFDPSFRWTWGEELKAVSKLDWRIMLWCFCVFMVFDMNRSNLIQANTDNFLSDLGMDTDDYNQGNTVFRATAICAEIPAQFLGRKMGFDRLIPIQLTVWAIISASQFWLTGRTTFLVTRFLIPLAGAGLLSNMLVYLSYFYTSIELPYRTTIWASSNKINDIIAPLLSVGILRLRGTAGKEGWRWLFLIESSFILIMAAWAWYALIPSIAHTKSRRHLRPKGWFSEREEKILVNRLLRDDPSKSMMHNRQMLTLKMFRLALADFDLWPLYILMVLVRVPSFTPELYFTLTLRSLGFSTMDANLLSIPPSVAFFITGFLICLLAEKTNQRCLATSVGQLCLLPVFVALTLVPFGVDNRWVVYTLWVLLLSAPSSTGYFGGWVSRNSNSVATRSVGAIFFGISLQISFLISTNIFHEADRPAYRTGMRVLLGFVVGNLVLVGLLKWYYRWRNGQRAAQWDAMDAEAKARYLEEHQDDKGARRLDFRFVS